jgi:hypothetical protein
MLVPATLGVVAILIVRALAAEAPATILEVFTRPACPHCERAEAFLSLLQREEPALRIVVHDVIADPVARGRLQDLAAARGVATVGVPAFHVNDQLLVGFDDAATTGARVRELVRAAARRAPPPSTVTVPIFGSLDAQALGLPAFTLGVGLVDGFNPCAMWVLLFVLSLLVNLQDRLRMLVIGGTFVVLSGVIYYAFMAAWLNLFLFVGMIRPAQILLGGIAAVIGVLNLKDAVAFGQGPSLQIPARAKPMIYARTRRILQAENLPAGVAAAAALAVLVNTVELLCTAGLPALYTQVLASQHLQPWQFYGYLGLYNLAYVFDDAVMLAVAVVTLSRRKLQERGGRTLKLVSALSMLALGLVMIARPDWLVLS